MKYFITLLLSSSILLAATDYITVTGKVSTVSGNFVGGLDIYPYPSAITNNYGEVQVFDLYSTKVFNGDLSVRLQPNGYLFNFKNTLNTNVYINLNGLTNGSIVNIKDYWPSYVGGTGTVDLSAYPTKVELTNHVDYVSNALQTQISSGGATEAYVNTATNDLGIRLTNHVDYVSNILSGASGSAVAAGTNGIVIGTNGTLYTVSLDGLKQPASANLTNWSTIDTNALPIDHLANPVDSKTFTMANKTIDWLFSNPSGGMSWSFTGAAAGHSLDINQSGGNPGTDMHLLHIEASDVDPTMLHLAPGSSTSRALKVNTAGENAGPGRFNVDASGKLTWGDGTNTVDASLERSDAGELLITTNLIAKGTITSTNGFRGSNLRLNDTTAVITVTNGSKYVNITNGTYTANGNIDISGSTVSAYSFRMDNGYFGTSGAASVGFRTYSASPSMIKIIDNNGNINSGLYGSNIISLGYLVASNGLIGSLNGSNLVASTVNSNAFDANTWYECTNAPVGSGTTEYIEAGTNGVLVATNGTKYTISLDGLKQPASEYLTNIDTRYQFGSANLTNVDTRYQFGNANLTNVDSRYQFGSANLTNVDSRYQFGSANLTNVDTRYQFGNANLTNVDTRYQFGSVNLTNWSNTATNALNASSISAGTLAAARMPALTGPVTTSSGAVATTLSVCYGLACSDETTALTTGTSKIKFRVPHAMTLTAVRASLSTAQTSGNIFTVDINEGGTTVISTKLTIDNTETTSTSAATAAVISDSALADDAEITIDIDQIGDGTAKGLKVWLIGTRS